MNKSTNIVKFYILANRLKQKIRTGWVKVKIDKERLESVAEHIYGTLILAIAIDSEYELDLNMEKILKILTLHELEEILMPDFTIRSGVTHEEKLLLGKNSVKQVVEGLMKAEEIENLLDEFNERKTKEAIFCYHIDKIECDFQAKLYDLEGVFDIEQAKKDLDYYGEDGKQVEELAQTASDYWIEYDRKLYKDDKIFEDLLNEIKYCEKFNFLENLKEK